VKAHLLSRSWENAERISFRHLGGKGEKKSHSKGDDGRKSPMCAPDVGKGAPRLQVVGEKSTPREGKKEENSCTAGRERGNRFLEEGVNQSAETRRKKKKKRLYGVRKN